MYGAAHQLVGALNKISERQDRLEYTQNNTKQLRKQEADVAFASSQDYSGAKFDELINWMSSDDVGNIRLAIKEMGSVGGDMWGSMQADNDLNKLIEGGGNSAKL